MLYKKNNSKKLDTSLFKNPTSEYRGTPFWAWNCELSEDLLLRQIEYLKEMGFGGFHMHTRSGMATTYLSDEFMSLIKACVEKAKKEDMLAYLYDEDRWPSGAAGGYVTKNKNYRGKTILLTQKKDTSAVTKAESVDTGKTYLLACYDISLNPDGTLNNYEIIGEEQEAKGNKWYIYVHTLEDNGWYNNQAYVDTLSKEAIDKFIDITHKRYKEYVGDDFGKTVPSIFTDEPEFSMKWPLKYADGNGEATMPWTFNMEDEYFKKYNCDILKTLPEVFWDLPDNAPSVTRYRFHDFICELFTQNYMDNCGKWCSENNIAFTGHVMEEATLVSQTHSVGETMRTYRSMGIPGIDMLCDKVELTTAKQAQSVVHQQGREAMLSELYGVTNWDFDFRGHKFQGDWQAALGVTVRVPHLSWVSMKGSAKRDYPASISYQSPWFKEYPYVENHFARLNTALTRGKAVETVGVIHPVESCWISFGPSSTSSGTIRELEDNFTNVTNWLLFGTIDFDYISESLLDEIGGEPTDKLNMGEMNYSAVIVPALKTIRKTTLLKLEKFRKNGGRLIFMGSCPEYVDAVKSDDAKALYESSIRIEMSENALLKALEPERFIEIRTDEGTRTEDLIHALRDDNGEKWLFIAHAKHMEFSDVPWEKKVKITLKGEYTPTLYDTVSGEISPVYCEYKNGNTVIPVSLYSYDSLLYNLKEGKSQATVQKVDDENSGESFYVSNVPPSGAAGKDYNALIYTKTPVCYSLSEDNVYLLDAAEYKLDDGEFLPCEEILRIDQKCRDILKFPKANGQDVQPWVIGKETISHFVTLKYVIESEIDLSGLSVALEDVEAIELNGKAVELKKSGWYVDESIIKYPIPDMKKGENILLIKVPIGKRTSIEYGYLLGSFGVCVNGCTKKITALPELLSFDDITKQGLAFYGGNITYKTEVSTDDCDCEIIAGRYRGSVISVSVDGKPLGKIAYEPYTLKTHLAKGKHIIEYTLFGNRVNTFASIHNYSTDRWYGPSIWYKNDLEGWCYEYSLKPVGILSSPIVKY